MSYLLQFKIFPGVGGRHLKKKTAILESKLFATNRKARGRRNRTKGAERGEVTWPKRHVWHV